MDKNTKGTFVNGEQDHKVRSLNEYYASRHPEEIRLKEEMEEKEKSKNLSGEVIS